MLATSLARAVRPATLRGAGFAGRALPAPRVIRPAAMTRQLAAAASSNPIAVFDTSMGTFEAELFMDRMPITASNFVDLANTGFYDGLHFHRVIDGCVVPPPPAIVSLTTPTSALRTPCDPPQRERRAAP